MLLRPFETTARKSSTWSCARKIVPSNAVPSVNDAARREAYQPCLSGFDGLLDTKRPVARGAALSNPSSFWYRM
jgi:hypothetical protein